MRRWVGRAFWLPALLLASAACNKTNDTSQGPTGNFQGSQKPSPIKEIMMKIAQEPNSLTQVIGKELKAGSPKWEDIQPQTKEFVDMASSLSKYDPPKGSKESWTKLTSEYVDNAKAMDKAAQAKDKDKAMAAHNLLSNACMACHREHRMMGGPPGGPGGRPGGPGRRPGGPGGPPPGRGSGDMPPS
jgi:hypothetical protein